MMSLFLDAQGRKNYYFLPGRKIFFLFRKTAKEFSRQ